MSRGSLAFGPHLNLTAAKTDIPSALEKVGWAKGGRGKRWAGPRGKSLTNLHATAGQLLEICLLKASAWGRQDSSVGK